MIFGPLHLFSRALVSPPSAQPRPTTLPVARHRGELGSGPINGGVGAAKAERMLWRPSLERIGRVQIQQRIQEHLHLSYDLVHVDDRVGLELLKRVIG
jgi:hypothetical protein